MDQTSRAQIRLILEDADIRAKKAVDGRLTAIYADHAAKGRLKSGATVKAALAAMEEIAGKSITDRVDQVAGVAKDTEAFGMIRETVEGLLRFLAGQLSGIATMAGGGGSEDAFQRVFEAAETRFGESREHLRRQVEIQRFTRAVLREYRSAALQARIASYLPREACTQASTSISSPTCRGRSF